MEQLGKYQLIRKLATGGMAEIFLAKAAGPMGFQKTLVVKRILPHLAEDPAFVAMFLAEAKLAAALNHPNIVQIFDFGEEAGTYYIAMEYVDGPTVRTLQRQAESAQVAMPFTLAAKIMSLACEGMAYAHDQADPETGKPLNLIHRDISPDNIILSRAGTVKVLDFGVAKVATNRGLTRSGMVKGKIAYMSPEQLADEPLDRRADVFSLGLVFFELLTGQLPFEDRQDAAIVQALMTPDPLPPITQFRADTPPALARIVGKALDKEVATRYPTAKAFQLDLERFILSQGEPVQTDDLARLVLKMEDPSAVTEPRARAPGSGQVPTDALPEPLLVGVLAPEPPRAHTPPRPPERPRPSRSVERFRVVEPPPQLRAQPPPPPPPDPEPESFPPEEPAEVTRRALPPPPPEETGPVHDEVEPPRMELAPTRELLPDPDELEAAPDELEAAPDELERSAEVAEPDRERTEPPPFEVDVADEKTLVQPTVEVGRGGKASAARRTRAMVVGVIAALLVVAGVGVVATVGLGGGAPSRPSAPVVAAPVPPPKAPEPPPPPIRAEDDDAKPAGAEAKPAGTEADAKLASAEAAEAKPQVTASKPEGTPAEAPPASTEAAKPAAPDAEAKPAAPEAASKPAEAEAKPATAEATKEKPPAAEASAPVASNPEPVRKPSSGKPKAERRRSGSTVVASSRREAPAESAKGTEAGGNGTVEFRIRPFAQVFLDGRDLGQTPFAPVSASAGKHSLRLVNARLGKDTTVDFVVKPNEANIFKYNFREE